MNKYISQKNCPQLHIIQKKIHKYFIHTKIKLIISSHKKSVIFHG